MRHLFGFGVLLLTASGPAFAAVDQGLLALVPPGAKIITGVDVNQAKNSQFGQYILNRINTEDRSLEELIQQTGFDPRRDLEDFLFASPGSSEGSESRFAVLVRGNFDKDRIRAMAKSKGAAIQKYQGVDVFVDRSEHQPTAFAFADAGVLVLGDIATVQQILGNRANPTPLNEPLQQLVSSTGANNDAWFVSRMPGAYLANHLKQQTSQPAAAQALDSIVQSSGGIEFGDIVRLSFDAIARSPKDAQSLVDVIRFLTSLVQMNREKGIHAEALAAAIDQMSLQADGDAVHVSFSLPEKTLEQLADTHQGEARRHPGNAAQH